MHRADSLDLLYVGTLPPHNGGTAIVGYQLLCGLAGAGHTIRAIAPITSNVLGADDIFARVHPEIGLTRFPVPCFDSSPDRPPSADYRRYEDAAIRDCFRRVVSERRPDLVIVGRETFARSLPAFALAEKIPSLLIVHGTGLIGMLHSFAAAEREHLVNQFKKVDLIVGVARHMIAGPMRQLGLPRAAFIANPVDLMKFSPAPKDPRLLAHLGLRDDQFIIAHFSNLKPLKRASDLIRSAREVVRRVPHAAYLIVGDGICRDALEAECREEGLQERFRFVGWIDHDEVPKYVNLADVVVMPSESEAAALVYLETQACARLLIASDVAGAREIIRDRETGLLFRMGEIADLTATLVLAANDGPMRERIGRAARESAKVYDLARFVSEYEAVIRKVIECRRAGIHGVAAK